MTARDNRRHNMRRIVEMLGTSLMDTASIAREIGMKPTTVRSMLMDLHAEGAVSFRTVATTSGVSCKRLWTAGEDTTEQPLEWDGIRRTNVQSWPLHLVRDALVSALFGPARGVANG